MIDLTHFWCKMHLCDQSQVIHVNQAMSNKKIIFPTIEVDGPNSITYLKSQIGQLYLSGA